jgi:hypothetical protein
MNRRYLTTILTAILVVVSNISILNAQCSIENKYFQSGEKLEYDLYIKLGFAVTKGGYATMKTQSTNYSGKDAYKMTLVSHSQGFARKVFALSDTLACYTGKDLTPLAYHKDAHEGGDYTKERLTYQYPGDGTVKIRSIRHKNGDFKFDENINAPSCTYDLVSILFYCRTLNYSNMKDGSETKVNFISGKKRGNMRIVYNGKEKVKANDGNKYNCIKLTLYVADEAFDNGKEAMKVFISDDDNRMPIRLETKLKVGSTRVILKNYSGNKYPLNTAN